MTARDRRDLVIGRGTQVHEHLFMYSKKTSRRTIRFRIDSDKVGVLDQLAKAREQDRSSLLNEAVEAYLDVQRWQIEHIQASIKQADAGELICHEGVRKMATKWRHR